MRIYIFENASVVWSGVVRFGDIRFKPPTLMNQAPHIEPDAAFKRRVQVFLFCATFDESQHPGCIARAMERRDAPAALREFPDRLSMMLREERPGILFKWIKAAQRFIENGEHLRDVPSAVRTATAMMFHEADIIGRLAERLEYGTEYRVSNEELIEAGQELERDMGMVNQFDMQRLSVLLESKGCKRSENVMWFGRRRRGWIAVRIALGWS